jgi:ribosomal protein L37E
MAMTDGGEDPYEMCPDCGKTTYVHDEGTCLACGYSHTEKYCALCHTPLNLTEAYESELCSYHQWTFEKNEKD